jgi:mycofactocin system transcriptional regulator
MSNVTHHSTGRPPATSHAAIEAAAFRLFTARGFEETTVDDIAEAVGVGRRTLFRYFPSKFDIPWGQFDDSLAFFRETLAAMPADIPLWEAVHRGVVLFNTFDPDVIDQHRTRMALILQTPSLQAHSVLMYQQWRLVISEYVAERRGQAPTDPLPTTIGHVSLALAISAYEQWLRQPRSSLTTLLGSSLGALRSYLDSAY